MRLPEGLGQVEAGAAELVSVADRTLRYDSGLPSWAHGLQLQVSWPFGGDCTNMFVCLLPWHSAPSVTAEPREDETRRGLIPLDHTCIDLRALISHSMHQCFINRSQVKNMRPPSCGQPSNQAACWGKDSSADPRIGCYSPVCGCQVLQQESSTVSSSLVSPHRSSGDLCTAPAPAQADSMDRRRRLHF